MPEAGLPSAEFARKKFGCAVNARAASDLVTQLGTKEGIQFDFRRVASAPNTVDAHRLILHSAIHNRSRNAAREM